MAWMRMNSAPIGTSCNDEGGRGAIGRFDALLADVKTDEQPAISNRAAVTAAPSLFLSGSVKFDSRSANS